MRRLIAAALALAAPSIAIAADKGPMIDVPAIMGEPRPVVDKAMGKPSKCEATKYGERCTYPGRHQIVFIKGKADWMTLYVDAPLSPGALSTIGFQPEPPDNRLGGDMRWNKGMLSPIRVPDSMKDIVRPGETLYVPVHSVSAIQGEGGKVDYIYVKASTP